MRRRRLVVFAGVAVLAAGLAWWLLSDGLNDEERRLVGTWRIVRGPYVQFWQFTSDRRSYFWHPTIRGVSGRTVLFAGPWSAREQRMVLDNEPSQVRRALRPLLDRLGVAVESRVSFTLEAVADDEITIRTANGERLVWTRAPAD